MIMAHSSRRIRSGVQWGHLFLNNMINSGAMVYPTSPRKGCKRKFRGRPVVKVRGNYVLKIKVLAA